MKGSPSKSFAVPSCGWELHRKVVLLALFFAARVSWLAGQDLGGTIEGRVAGPDGEVVAGALITATHSTTNSGYTTQSNDVGRFAMPSVRLGVRTSVRT